MWDYDKLFTDGNIVGVKNCYENFIYNQIIDPSENNYWVDCYQNNELSCKEQFVINDKNGSEYTTDFEIQYIIRLDEHGNVVEKLFDRERDMAKPMPKLEAGMFGKIGTFHLDEYHEIDFVSTDDFIVIGDKVLFVQFNQVYNWSFLNDLIDTSTNNQKALYDEDMFTPIEIYKNANLLSNEDDEFQVIWRHPKYQAYLDSKSN